jgi:hypothetical protein
VAQTRRPAHGDDRAQPRYVGPARSTTTRGALLHDVQPAPSPPARRPTALSRVLGPQGRARRAGLEIRRRGPRAQPTGLGGTGPRSRDSFALGHGPRLGGAGQPHGGRRLRGRRTPPVVRRHWSAPRRAARHGALSVQHHPRARPFAHHHPQMGDLPPLRHPRGTPRRLRPRGPRRTLDTGRRGRVATRHPGAAPVKDDDPG